MFGSGLVLLMTIKKDVEKAKEDFVKAILEINNLIED